jgi:hypothetical protein
VVFRPKWLGWHAFAVVAVLGMLWLGDWQFHRAQAGNGLSWAYTFEWPIFAVLGAVFWAKTIIEELAVPDSGRQEAAEIERPAGAGLLASSPLGAPAPGDEDNQGSTGYAARLSAEVQGHGRWHGLR